VALFGASHPGVLRAPSGDAVVPVVGRLGVSPWKVVLDDGWGGGIDFASVAAATSVVISVTNALLLFFVPLALVVLVTLSSLLSFAVSITTIIGAWLDLGSWFGVSHTGGWLSLTNSISPIQTGTVVQCAWLRVLARFVNVAPKLVAPFFIFVALAIIHGLVPCLAIITEILIQIIQLRDTLVISGTSACIWLWFLFLFGGDNQRT